MVVDDEQLPVKPNFSALSAKEQRAGKVEFRRVRGLLCSSDTLGAWCSNWHLHACFCPISPYSSRQQPTIAMPVPGLLSDVERRLLLLLPCPLAAAADTGAPQPHDAAEDGLAVAVPAHHREPQTGYAHEPQNKKGAGRALLGRLLVLPSCCRLLQWRNTMDSCCSSTTAIG